MFEPQKYKAKLYEMIKTNHTSFQIEYCEIFVHRESDREKKRDKTYCDASSYGNTIFVEIQIETKKITMISHY